MENGFLHFKKSTVILSNLTSFMVLVFLSLLLCLPAKANEQQPWSKHQNARELVNLRGHNVKHFSLPSGQSVAYFASGTIHYQSGAQWLEIDNTIKPNLESGKDYLYANVTNNFNVFYPGSIQSHPLKIKVSGVELLEQITKVYAMDINGNTLATLTPNNKCEVLVKGNTITYANYFNGIDLVYTQNNAGKKFELKINQASALLALPSNATKLIIEEEVSLPTGVNMKEENNHIILSKNNQQLADYLSPEAYDATANLGEIETNSQGQITAKLVNNKLLVQTVFDMNWITSKQRNFPIYLDPSANYGPFNVSMATGRMTSATGAKADGFLRLAGANTFTWAKFDIASFANLGAISMDSANYWGYFYTAIQTADKIAKVVEMDSLDPVSATNLSIVANINAKTNLTLNYAFGASAASGGNSWRKAFLDTAIHNPVFRANITRGYTSIGMSYISGNATFGYHYGREAIGGTNNALVCYLEVFYTLPPCSNPVAGGTITGNNLVCGGSNTTLTLTGATTGLGTTYQWQESVDGVNWTNITSANNTSLVASINLDSNYYRCEVICSGGTPAYSNAYLVKADFFEVTALTPYEEGFEGISANNQLPSCMVSTNLNTLT